jgi:deoxyribose-phosphate aldolase
MPSQSTTITLHDVTLAELAKMIDLSLLLPKMKDDEILKGLEQARDHRVATACIKPYCIEVAKTVLAGTDVGICAVIGFPHGNSTTEVKVFEATKAVEAGANEIDMVINIGKALSGYWDYVENEIKAINEAVNNAVSKQHSIDQDRTNQILKVRADQRARAAQSGSKQSAPTPHSILKVIFENDYLEEKHIRKLCEICSRLRVAFVKTSTGYGFVKGDDGRYSYAGATLPHLKLMQEVVESSGVEVKAAGGVRTLDDLLKVRAIGVTRIGATAAAEILEEAKKRGIGETAIDVTVDLESGLQSAGGY